MSAPGGRPVWPALVALAGGGFGIGVAEFVTVGVLPAATADLLPGEWSRSHADALAHGGLLVTAYAIGVLIGAPLVAVLFARTRLTTLAVTTVAVMLAANLLSAVAPVFPLEVAARLLAGLPNGAYAAIALLLAAELLGPARRGTAATWVVGGISLSNVVGVPAVTLLAQGAGWRTAYAAVAAVFALTAVALVLLVPRSARRPAAGGRAGLQVLGSAHLWIALAVGTIGTGGFFAVYSYIAPITTEVAVAPASAVPLVLLVTGVGMTLGTVLAGPVVDRGPLRALLLWAVVALVALLLLGLLCRTLLGLLVGSGLLGLAALAEAAALQVRLIEVAPGSELLATGLGASTLNAANSVGAVLGGAALSAGLGWTAPIWVGVGLAACGVVIVLGAVLLHRRSRAPLATG